MCKLLILLYMLSLVEGRRALTSAAWLIDHPRPTDLPESPRREAGGKNRRPRIELPFAPLYFPSFHFGFLGNFFLGDVLGYARVMGSGGFGFWNGRGIVDGVTDQSSGLAIFGEPASWRASGLGCCGEIISARALCCGAGFSIIVSGGVCAGSVVCEGFVMAIVRRVRNPWKRSMMALRASRGTVFVLRHGSTDRNRGGVGQDQIRGHADIPMTAGGEQEVKVTAWQIGAVRIEKIWASDLRRTARTAEIVADENAGYPEVELTRGLRSWDMGAGMEGKVTTPDVIEQIEDWVENDGVVPPGGESFRSYCTRVIAAATPVFARAVEYGETLAIVAHGRVVQVIDFWIAAGCDEECMHVEFAEYLADEPDTVPPGGGVQFKNDGLGWLGVVIGSGVPSVGTQVAAGSYVRPQNKLAEDQDGVPAS